MVDKSKIRTGAETAQFWFRLTWPLAIVLWGLWESFVGDGVRKQIQDFLGVTEINARLEAVERNMPAPRVVEWDLAFMRQLGDCNYRECEYLMVGARTPYGEGCGAPSKTVPYIRLEQQPPRQISFDEFQPVELGRVSRSFSLPLKIPPNIPDGKHHFRVEVWYPSCEGVNEPIPRYTPWLALNVTQPKDG